MGGEPRKTPSNARECCLDSARDGRIKKPVAADDAGDLEQATPVAIPAKTLCDQPTRLEIGFPGQWGWDACHDPAARIAPCRAEHQIDSALNRYGWRYCCSGPHYFACRHMDLLIGPFRAVGQIHCA